MYERIETLPDTSVDIPISHVPHSPNHPPRVAMTIYIIIPTIPTGISMVTTQCVAMTVCSWDKKKKKKSVKMEREAAEICGAEWFVSVLKRYSGFSIVVPESCESHLSLHFP